MKPTLVILAAGMGSRYGGLKQLEPVGPNGETIMDYSIFDAVRAGFARVVFIVRPDMEQAVRADLVPRYAAHVPVDLAFQRMDLLPRGFVAPAGRTRPWGTGHAVLAAAAQVREPFGVVNADDFYGRRSFQVLADFLRAPQDPTPPTYGIVAFRLGDTLSPAGTVNRAICRTDAAGWLQELTETRGIARADGDGVHKSAAGEARRIPADTPVSMNMWGFLPHLFVQLRDALVEFLDQHGQSNEAECDLPGAVQRAVRLGRARVKLLPTDEKWCGVTYPEDRPSVAAAVQGRIAAGEYPERLWA